MEAWTSYALSDFLMFSPASYFRRYAIANAALWPGQVLVLAVAVWLWWSARHPGRRHGLLIAPLLAALWGFVAAWFLHHQYAQINLAADWFALAFSLQALLLLASGLSGRRRRRMFAQHAVRPWHPGMVLFAYALLIHPLVGLAFGRPWRGIELFGVAPDATALATFGLLLTGSLALNWPLLLIPLAWCAVSALTYLAMGYLHGIAPLVLAITALAATGVLNHLARGGTQLREGT